MNNRERFPIIHKKFVITSTYCLKDRSIRYEKEDFIKQNYRLFKKLYHEVYEEVTKWWATPIAQQLEIKIRIKFGYSPRTYVRDILWHFKFIFFEWEEKQKAKK